MSNSVTECRKYTNKHCLPREINSTSIECISGALTDGVVVEIVRSVQVIIDSATMTKSGVIFEYKDDPVFKKLIPQKTIPL